MRGSLKAALAATAAMLPATAALAEACASAPAPVVTLDYGSRYIDDDASRSTIDTESNAAVNRALRPIDAFIRDLSRDSDAVRQGAEEGPALANCVLSQIATWARADALSDLDSFTARLSVGSRIAGIAEAYRQVRPFATELSEVAQIETWLSTRAVEQMTFWEEEATPGAKVGNLRAWASLAVFLVGDLTGNDAQRFWAAGSAVGILCTARDDGSLPQETKRGKYGLHYQFHAIAPLVTLAAHLADRGPAITTVCDDALQRVVAYALDDYEAGGLATEGYAGVRQSYFDGSETLESHELAWIPAYLSIFPEADLTGRGIAFDNLGNSKLGGDQGSLWPSGS